MLERLIAIVQAETGLKNISITEDMVLRKDLKINSYDFIQVICAIEDEFDIEIADKDIVGLVTVGDVVKYIESKKQ